MDQNPHHFEILNDSFGVDVDLSAEDASPLSVVVPQFLQPHAATAEYGKHSSNPWDPRLVVDLALGIEPLEDILTRYGLSEVQYNRLVEVPTFRRDLGMTMREVRENGLSFHKKAAVQAESYLQDVDDIVQDKSVAASVRLSAITSCVLWGKLLPKEEKGEAQGGTQVNLQINFT